MSDNKIDAGIKWRNDIYVKGKKISGILIDSVQLGQKKDYVLYSVGINVETSDPKFINMREVLGGEAGDDLLTKVVLVFLDQFSIYYKRFQNNDFSVNEIDFLFKNEEVTILEKVSRKFQGSGQFLGVDENGFALLKNGEEVNKFHDGSMIIKSL